MTPDSRQARICAEAKELLVWPREEQDHERYRAALRRSVSDLLKLVEAAHAEGARQALLEAAEVLEAWRPTDASPDELATWNRIKALAEEGTL